MPMIDPGKHVKNTRVNVGGFATRLLWMAIWVARQGMFLTDNYRARRDYLLQTVCAQHVFRPLILLLKSGLLVLLLLLLLVFPHPKGLIPPPVLIRCSASCLPSPEDAMACCTSSPATHKMHVQIGGALNPKP